jgi:hypothetical protein
MGDEGAAVLVQVIDHLGYGAGVDLAGDGAQFVLAGDDVPEARCVGMAHADSVSGGMGRQANTPEFCE